MAIKIIPTPRSKNIVAFGEIVILILESGKLYKDDNSKHSSTLLTKLDESIEFLYPIFQIG